MRQSLSSKEPKILKRVLLSQQDIKNSGGIIKYFVKTVSDLTSLDPDIGDLAFIAEDSVLAFYNGTEWLVLAGFDVNEIYNYNIETISSPAYTLYEVTYEEDLPTPTEGINFAYVTHSDSYYLYKTGGWKALIRKKFDYETCAETNFGDEYSINQESFISTDSDLKQISPYVDTISDYLDKQMGFATSGSSSVSYYNGLYNLYYGDSLKLFSWHEICNTVYKQATRGTQYGFEVTIDSGLVVNISEGKAYVTTDESIYKASQSKTLTAAGAGLKKYALLELQSNNSILATYSAAVSGTPTKPSPNSSRLPLAYALIEESNITSVEDIRILDFIRNGFYLYKIDNENFYVEPGRAYTNTTLCQKDSYTDITIDTSTNKCVLIQVDTSGNVTTREDAYNVLYDPTPDAGNVRLGFIRVLSGTSSVFTYTPARTNLISKLPLMVEVGSDKYISTTLNKFTKVTSYTTGVERYGSNNDDDKVYYDFGCYLIRYVNTYYEYYTGNFHSSTNKYYYSYKQLTLPPDTTNLIHDDAISANRYIQKDLKWLPLPYVTKNTVEELAEINYDVAIVSGNLYSKHLSQYGVVSGLEVSQVSGVNMQLSAGVAWVKNSNITRKSYTTFSLDALVDSSLNRYDLIELSSDGTISIIKSTEAITPQVPDNTPGRIQLAKVLVSDTTLTITDLRDSGTYYGWFQHGLRISEVNDLSEMLPETGAIAKVGTDYYVYAAGWQLIGAEPIFNGYYSSQAEFSGSVGDVLYSRADNLFYVYDGSNWYKVEYFYYDSVFNTSEAETVYFRPDSFFWTSDSPLETVDVYSNGTLLGTVIQGRTSISVSAIPTVLDNITSGEIMFYKTTTAGWVKCTISGATITQYLVPYGTKANYAALLAADTIYGDYGLGGSTLYFKTRTYRTWSTVSYTTEVSLPTTGVEGSVVKVGSNYYIRRCRSWEQLTIKFTETNLTNLQNKEIANGAYYYITDRGCLYLKTSGIWNNVSTYTVANITDLGLGMEGDIVYVSSIGKHLYYTKSSYLEKLYSCEIKNNTPRINQSSLFNHLPKINGVGPNLSTAMGIAY